MMLQAAFFKIYLVSTIYMGSILSNNTLGLQVKSLLEKAIKFHQKGRILDAEKIYKKILAAKLDGIPNTLFEIHVN